MHRMVENWYRLGIPVVSQMWTDAPHVQMYRLYPEEYTGLLDAFVCQTTDWCYHFEGKSGQKPKAHA